MPFTDMLAANRTIIKDHIRPVAQALAAEHEMSFKVLKGSFNRGQFKMILQFGIPAIEEEMRLEFCAAIAPHMGLPETILGTTYTIEGATFKIIDINPKMNEKCIRVNKVNEAGEVIAFKEDGTTPIKFKVSPSRVRQALGLPDPQAEEREEDEADA